MGKSPGGDSAFSLGAELRGSTQSAQSSSRFGMFNYWTDMHANNAGQYYGNEFIKPGANNSIQTDDWNCVEVMLKLNSAQGDTSGEAKLWINGELIEHYGPQFPIGSWNQLTFTQGAGQAFEGFKWRTSAKVLFNSIWIKNYSPMGSDTSPNDILYDHIVVAKRYIGPIHIPSGSGIQNIYGESVVNIYPNPAGDFVRLSKSSSFEIQSLQGKRLAAFENAEAIDLRAFENGVYLLTGKGWSHKLVISR